MQLCTYASEFHLRSFTHHSTPQPPVNMNATDKGPTFVKSVRHNYTDDERKALNEDLLKNLERKSQTEAEFQQVKSRFKAKLDEAEARTTTLCINLRNGWEQRSVECRVVYRPADRKKDFYRLDTDTLALTEDMEPADYQAELLQAESGFENKESISLWEAGADKGLLIVGRLKDRWYSALRCNVGRQSSEQPAFKNRFDAINRAAKRLKTWLKENLGDNAKGFEEPILKAVEAHRERAE